MKKIVILFLMILTVLAIFVADNLFQHQSNSIQVSTEPMEGFGFSKQELDTQELHNLYFYPETNLLFCHFKSNASGWLEVMGPYSYKSSLSIVDLTKAQSIFQARWENTRDDGDFLQFLAGSSFYREITPYAKVTQEGESVVLFDQDNGRSILYGDYSPTYYVYHFTGENFQFNTSWPISYYGLTKPYHLVGSTPRRFAYYTLHTSHIEKEMEWQVPYSDKASFFWLVKQGYLVLRPHTLNFVIKSDPPITRTIQYSEICEHFDILYNDRFQMEKFNYDETSETTIISFHHRDRSLDSNYKKEVVTFEMHPDKIIDGEITDTFTLLSREPYIIPVEIPEKKEKYRYFKSPDENRRTFWDQEKHAIFTSDLNDQDVQRLYPLKGY